MSLFSFAEEITNLYFLKRNYFTLRNHHYLDPKNRGSRDIDIIAYNGNELYLISCKRGSLSSIGEKKELKLFEQGAKVIRNAFKYIKKKPKYFYAAEYITEHNKVFFTNNNIEYRKLSDLLGKIVSISRKEMGENELDGREHDVVGRTIKFLIKNELL